MAYSFDQVFAADPSNPSNVAQNASITIFAPGDGTMTPLTITDPDGQPLANPLTVNTNGFGSAFSHATLDRVAWEGGGFTGFFTSYEGMKAEAVAARTAADAAAAAAAASAATASAPADTAIAAAVNTPASATKAALDATYDLKTEGRRVVNMGKLPGAVGDGITDNTAVFQAALDRVGSDTPSIIFHLPEGVWLTDGLKLKSNTTIEGVCGGTFGLNSFNATRTTVLKLKANATRSLITDYAVDNFTAGVTLRGLQLDGNKTNQTTALSGVELYPAASGQDPLWRMERLYIHDFKGDGIKVGAFRRAAKITDSEVMANDGNGITLNATDCTVRGTLIGQNLGDGIVITGSLQHIHGCDIFNNTNGIKIGPLAQGVMIDNCGIDINRRHGVTCEAPRVVISATNFQTNGTEANDTYSHVDLGFPGTTATGCVVHAVAMRHDATVSANKAKYGIQTNVPVNVSGIAYNPAEVPWVSGLSGNAALMALAFRDQGIVDGVGIHMGTGGAGIRLGTASTQKLAFWGATPIVRPTMTNAAATDLNTTTLLVNEIRSKLVSLGLVQ